MIIFLETKLFKIKAVPNSGTMSAQNFVSVKGLQGSFRKRVSRASFGQFGLFRISTKKILAKTQKFLESWKVWTVVTKYTIICLEISGNCSQERAFYFCVGYYRLYKWQKCWLCWWASDYFRDFQKLFSWNPVNLKNTF